MTVNDSSSVATEEKIMKKLREQQKDNKAADESRKTFHKCLHKILNRNGTHQLLNEAAHEEVCYLAAIFRGHLR